MSDGPKFKSDRPEVVEWWHATEKVMHDFYADVRAWVDKHGMGRTGVILSGWGMHLGGLEAAESDRISPPEGWRLIPERGRNRAFLVPLRRSKAGKALSDEMRALEVKGDPRHKLPGWTWDFFRAEPGLFFHEGTVWMSAGTAEGVDLSVWEPCPNSAYWLAKEAHAAEKVDA